MSKARKIRDIVAKTGEYTDNNGDKKGRYVNAGSLFYNDEEKSYFIILNRTFNPAGVPNLSDKGEADSVFLSCFNPDRKGGSGTNQSGHSTSANSTTTATSYAQASGHYSGHPDDEQDIVPF